MSSTYCSNATPSVSPSQKFLQPAWTPCPFWLPTITCTIYLYLSFPVYLSLYLMLSAIYLLRGLRSLGGDCCLGTNFYLSMVFMISRASEGLNFSLCLGLIWYSLTALANVSLGIQFYYLKFIIKIFNLQLNFIFQILFKLMSKRKVLP